MINKFLSELYERIGFEVLTAEEIKYLIEEDDLDVKMRYVPFYVIIDVINKIKFDLEQQAAEEQRRLESQKPYKKFMFVEDGSVDTDTLILEMERTNPEIRVIVYRQGSKRPELLDILGAKDD